LPIDNSEANVHVYWLSKFVSGPQKPGRSSD
jgi:hypothetical protein